jgi:hypothetical protein
VVLGWVKEILGVAEKVNVATDDRFRKQRIHKAAFQLANPDGNCLPSDKNDPLFSDDFFKTRDDSLRLV